MINYFHYTSHELTCHTGSHAIFICIFSDQPDSKKGEPLYEGSRLNLLESMMLLITFVMRHQLSREATKDLLQLVELHCMVPNLCRSSLHNFYSYFSHTSTPVQRHYLCAFCKNYTGTVSNQECLICGKKKERNFMYIPIAGQLQSILSGIFFFSTCQTLNIGC